MRPDDLKQKSPDTGSPEILTRFQAKAWQWIQRQCSKAPLLRICAACSVIIFLCLALIVFHESDEAGIQAVLDARDQAISSRDINAYSQLIADDYRDNGRDKEQVLAQTADMFRTFIELHMRSFDREVRLLGKGAAECRQSYRLRVRAGTNWRQIVEREQISLKKTDAGWRVTAGL